MKSTQLLTDRLIQSIKADTGRIQITDARTQGLKLRVSRTGHKSFAVMMRDKAGKYTTITIGTYPDLSLREAREVACQIRVDMRTKGLEKPRTYANSKVGKITLRELLDEVQPVFAQTKKGWRPRGGPGSSAYTRNTIERVFRPLLDKPVERLTAEDFGRAANGYQPVRPLKGKDTANGQVSRALSYLSPVLDWAAHRGRKFDKIGAGRATRLDVAELRRVHDPATNDPTIKGKRQRVLSVEDDRCHLPASTIPCPKENPTPEHPSEE
ncbi:Arm DNA-binding domain-containing protein [Sulfitobacter sp. R18_1]|uniref:Arm DNA-binding domain-containing protein n=1 Tax=Sulfitobacter sp. R18_1 TaxID=2821104 RepID=UPI001ADCD993|nr:Arm DNA-binding domain-containing protein [Sulfitobacter sp. R18_1]MBO9432544.1 DUF4102 domain-containing protein [Sulfitobacter sp. R18_1]